MCRFGRHNLFCQEYFGLAGLKAKFRSSVALFRLDIKNILKCYMNMFLFKIIHEIVCIVVATMFFFFLGSFNGIFLSLGKQEIYSLSS